MGEKVKMGETYRDEITGFEGKVTGRHEYLHGCVRYTLEAEGKDGKAGAVETFDEQRLVAVETKARPLATATSGGPRDEPSVGREPSR